MRPDAAPGQQPGAPEVVLLKWEDKDFAEYADGKLPMGKPTDEWAYGDVDGNFKKAALVLDETFSTSNNSHTTLETRSAMAYWQNGKLFLHCSTQSTVQTVVSVARWLHMEQTDIVIISGVHRRRLREQGHAARSSRSSRRCWRRRRTPRC